MSPFDKLQHLPVFGQQQHGAKSQQLDPPNFSEMGTIIFTVLSSDVSKRRFTSLKKDLWENQGKWILSWCKETVPLWAWVSEYLTNTHSEHVLCPELQEMPHTQRFVVLGIYALRGKNPFSYSKKKHKQTICLRSPNKPWHRSNQASPSKTILMYVKLGTTNLSHLRKFKPIPVQLRSSKHFENMKELNHMSCLR